MYWEMIYSLLKENGINWNLYFIKGNKMNIKKTKICIYILDNFLVQFMLNLIIVGYKKFIS